MKARVVAVDANVLVFLAQPRPDDPERLKRWSQVQGTVRELQEQGAEFTIPAPALAELYAGGDDGRRIAAKLEKQGAHLRVDAFDDEAARIAGNIMATRLRNRPKTGATSRHLVKFDAMIIATAIASGADCILTTDSDIESCMQALEERSRIPVIDATAPKGQLTIIG